MREEAEKLREIVTAFHRDCARIDEETAGIRLSEDKWSLKEIIGHLIDSASNNHQRFIRLQMSKSLEFPDYKTEEWLQTGNYNSLPFGELFSLFTAYNHFLAQLIAGVDPAKLRNKWNISWQDVHFITLGDLITHYNEHLQLHLEHFRERAQEVSAFL